MSLVPYGNLHEETKLGLQHKKCKAQYLGNVLNWISYAFLTFNLDSLKSKKIQEELATTTTS